MPSLALLKFSSKTLQDRVSRIASLNQSLSQSKAGYRIPINTRTLSLKALQEAEAKVGKFVSNVQDKNTLEQEGNENPLSTDKDDPPLTPKGPGGTGPGSGVNSAQESEAAVPAESETLEVVEAEKPAEPAQEPQQNISVREGVRQAMIGRIGSVMEAQRSLFSAIPNMVLAVQSRAKINIRVPNGTGRLTDSLGRVRDETKSFLSDNLVQRLQIFVVQRAGPLPKLMIWFKSGMLRTLGRDQLEPMDQDLLMQTSESLETRPANVSIKVSSLKYPSLPVLPIVGGLFLGGLAGTAAWRNGEMVMVNVNSGVMGGLISSPGSFAHIAALGSYTSALDRLRGLPFDTVGLLGGINQWQFAVAMALSAVLVAFASGTLNRMIRAFPLVPSRFSFSWSSLVGNSRMVESKPMDLTGIGSYLGDKTLTDPKVGKILVITSPLLDKGSPDRLIAEGFLSQIRDNPSQSRQARIVYNSEALGVSAGNRESVRKGLIKALDLADLEGFNGNILQDLAVTDATDIISGIEAPQIQIIGTPDDIASWKGLSVGDKSITLLSFKSYGKMMNIGVEFKAEGAEAEQLRAILAGMGAMLDSSNTTATGGLVLPARAVNKKDFDAVWKGVQLILKQA